MIANEKTITKIITIDASAIGERPISGNSKLSKKGIRK
jgi:hypothetical protein